jgi:hypothetical protein
MRIVEILKPGRTSSRVRFEDSTVEVIPNRYAIPGKDYISVKMLKKHENYIHYEGDHISARLEGRKKFTIRNKDNICSATLAYNQSYLRAVKVWCLFMMEVTKEISFAEAVDYFARNGIKMGCRG